MQLGNEARKRVASLDELRISSKARSEEEVRADMDRPLKGDEPNLIGYWSFDKTGVQ